MAQTIYFKLSPLLNIYVDNVLSCLTSRAPCGGGQGVQYCMKPWQPCETTFTFYLAEIKKREIRFKFKILDDVLVWHEIYLRC